MKKIKLLTPLTIVPIVLTTTTPLIVGCSQKTLYEQLQDTVIEEFKELCKIPRPSDSLLFKVPFASNVLKASDYLKARVEKLTGAKVWQDKYANLWFDLPANDDSLADAPILVLQSHMDMVFSYDPDKYSTAPDPLTTVIEPVIETIDGKKILHTKDYKTSLGADNGIGIAQILALISNKNVKHGKLRIVFTNCEENGCQGAMLMVKGKEDDSGKMIAQPTTPELFNGIKNILSMDGECDGSCSISASGAIGSHYSKEFEPQSVSLPNKFKLKWSGFIGGHSADAARGNCGNPIKAATEVLNLLKDDKVQISSLNTLGTNVYNAVATGYELEFATNANEAKVKQAIQTIIDTHANEQYEFYYKDIKDAKYELTNSSFDKALSIDDSNKIIDLQMTLLYGKEETKEEEQQYIKTSANMGPSNLYIENNKYQYKAASYSRSDKVERVNQFKQENKLAAQAGGFDYLCDAEFPPWKEVEGNPMYNIVKKGLVAAGIPESEHSIGRWHGGVESSWWKWSMVNNSGITDGCACELGANVVDEHKPTESVELDSITANLKATIYCLEHANDLQK